LGLLREWQEVEVHLRREASGHAHGCDPASEGYKAVCRQRADLLASPSIFENRKAKPGREGIYVYTKQKDMGHYQHPQRRPATRPSPQTAAAPYGSPSWPARARPSRPRETRRCRPVRAQAVRRSLQSTPGWRRRGTQARPHAAPGRPGQGRGRPVWARDFRRGRRVRRGTRSRCGRGGGAGFHWRMRLAGCCHGRRWWVSKGCNWREGLY
jgi:hypothetical protein